MKKDMTVSQNCHISDSINLTMFVENSGQDCLFSQRMELLHKDKETVLMLKAIYLNMSTTVISPSN